MVHTEDQDNDKRCSVDDPTNVSAGGFLGSFDHTYSQVWNQKTGGFTLHTFSEDFETLTTDFISYEGKTLHSFSVKKGSRPSPSPVPTPAPTPAPTPSPS